MTPLMFSLAQEPNGTFRPGELRDRPLQSHELERYIYVTLPFDLAAHNRF